MASHIGSPTYLAGPFAKDVAPLEIEAEAGLHLPRVYAAVYTSAETALGTARPERVVRRVAVVYGLQTRLLTKATANPFILPARQILTPAEIGISCNAAHVPITLVLLTLRIRLTLA